MGSSIESLVQSLIKSGFKIEKEDSQKGKCMSKIYEMYTKLDKVGLKSWQYGCIKLCAQYVSSHIWLQSFIVDN